MPHITSILIGALAAVGAWALVVPAAETATKAPGAGDIHWPMDLARKGDRLSVTALRGDDRIQFPADPVNNVTVVAKGLVIPALPVRETLHSVPPRREAPARLAPPIPVGCDPVISAIAEPGLSRQLEHVTGHCVSQRDDVAPSVMRG
jgi:hypothetical protein